MMKNKAIFLDKDGTLVHNIPYNINSSLIKFKEGVFDGLKILQEHYILIIITNQSGIARGLFTEKQLARAIEEIIAMFSRVGVRVDSYYFCPHHPEGIVPRYTIPCQCRKPKPGMILKAAQDFSIDLSNSWTIGDSLTDLETGIAAGCNSILVDEALNEEFTELSIYPLVTAVTKGFLTAVSFINSKQLGQR